MSDLGIITLLLQAFIGPLYHALLCSIFCPSLPMFPLSAPAPALAQPHPAVGSWIQLELAVSGWNWLYPAAPAAPRRAPAVPTAAGDLGAHTQWNITYLQIFLVKQSKILS